jgi:hypothetical protein
MTNEQRAAELRLKVIARADDAERVLKGALDAAEVRGATEVLRVVEEHAYSGETCNELGCDWTKIDAGEGGGAAEIDAAWRAHVIKLALGAS